jgi:hypothetical protein
MGLPSCDHCETAWIYLTTYMIFNCAFNILIVLIIKNAGSSLMVIIMTLRLPLTQAAFCFPFIQSPPDVFRWTSGLGLAVILSGLVCYRWVSISNLFSYYLQSATASEEESAREEHDAAAVLPIFGVGVAAYATTLRGRKVTVPVRSAYQLRYGLYAQLGVVSSPATPHRRERGPWSNASSQSSPLSSRSTSSPASKPVSSIASPRRWAITTRSGTPPAPSSLSLSDNATSV